MKNTAASVRNRLLELARQRGEDFQLILTRYGLERLLYRLGQSEYRDRFVLKGALLFSLWDNQAHRPIRDVTEYGGIRVTLVGELAGARIPIQADIGFGDAVTPEPVHVVYPTLLGHPAPYLRAYPRETVIAEKYQALVNLGMANSRMKDFYDLWVMAHRFDFDGAMLSEAINNTFTRRETPLPEQTPSGLSAEFYGDDQKNRQWDAFLCKGMLLSSSTPLSLEEACQLLELFLMPPTTALKNGCAFTERWRPGGPWKAGAMD